jgi:hypothetical protein
MSFPAYEGMGRRADDRGCSSKSVRRSAYMLDIPGCPKTLSRACHKAWAVAPRWVQRLVESLRPRIPWACSSASFQAAIVSRLAWVRGTIRVGLIVAPETCLHNLMDLK